MIFIAATIVWVGVTTLILNGLLRGCDVLRDYQWVPTEGNETDSTEPKEDGITAPAPSPAPSTERRETELTAAAPPAAATGRVAPKKKTASQKRAVAKASKIRAERESEVGVLSELEKREAGRPQGSKGKGKASLPMPLI